jgi:hypothetical protein
VKASAEKRQGAEERSVDDHGRELIVEERQVGRDEAGSDDAVEDLPRKVGEQPVEYSSISASSCPGRTDRRLGADRHATGRGPEAGKVDDGRRAMRRLGRAVRNRGGRGRRAGPLSTDRWTLEEPLITKRNTGQRDELATADVFGW